jgi:hypothetical protein
MTVRYHPPLHASAALAQRVERAEIDFCAAAAATGLDSIDVAGGRALYSTPGSPLNKVLGLGVGAAVRDDDLDAIDRFYAGHGEPARIELCPLAAADLAPRLAARGYVLHEFENELARLLPVDERDEDRLAHARGSDLAVVAVEEADNERWVQAVAEGFAVAEGVDHQASSDAIARLADIMRPFTHPSIVRYLVHAGDATAGGGAAFLRDRILGVFGTATVPRFRRRGVQAALIAAALAAANTTADLAVATTAPGSWSQRTFERLGFQVIYTRAILVLPLHRAGHGPA